MRCSHFTVHYNRFPFNLGCAQRSKESYFSFTERDNLTNASQLADPGPHLAERRHPSGQANVNLMYDIKFVKFSIK